MSLTAYTSRTLYTPLQSLDRAVVLAEDGAIVKLGSRIGVEVESSAEIHDFVDDIIVPGFVDINVEGSARYEKSRAFPTSP
jgi:N-acetylglucosamine-6-phosphate deacetylase